MFTFSRLRETTPGEERKKTPLNTLDSLGFYVSASVCEMSTKAEQCEYGCVSPVMSPARGGAFVFLRVFFAFEGSCPW